MNDVILRYILLFDVIVCYIMFYFVILCYMMLYYVVLIMLYYVRLFLYYNISYYIIIILYWFGQGQSSQKQRFNRVMADVFSSISVPATQWVEMIMERTIGGVTLWYGHDSDQLPTRGSAWNVRGVLSPGILAGLQVIVMHNISRFWQCAIWENTCIRSNL